MEASPGRRSIIAVPSQIEQLLVNLVGNARDAMPDGGTIEISVREDDGDHVALRISDDGIGMDELGRGTTLSLWFPAVTPETPAVVEIRDRAAAPFAATILLVEDDDAVRELLRDILETAGLEVLVASDGVEAIEMAKGYAGTIDVLLSDVVMPKMGGAELSSRLAIDRPATSVIYMSGYPDRSVPGGRLTGDEDVLMKPFTPSQLLERIRATLRPSET